MRRHNLNGVVVKANRIWLEGRKRGRSEIHKDEMRKRHVREERRKRNEPDGEDEEEAEKFF
jgi:hypothetical protein